MKPPQVFKPKLLLCEGKDEVEFFSALLKHLNRSDVQIESVGGKHFFAPNIAALATDPKLSQVTDILIVRDADFILNGAGFASTWQSVTDALAETDFPFQRHTPHSFPALRASQPSSCPMANRTACSKRSVLPPFKPIQPPRV